MADPTSVSRHVLATRTAEFHICSRCGVVPMVTRRIDGQLYAVANVTKFEDLDASLLRLSPVSLDDEGDGERLARRKRNWIADVEFLEKGVCGASHPLVRRRADAISVTSRIVNMARASLHARST